VCLVFSFACLTINHILISLSMHIFNKDELLGVWSIFQALN
jgi:hypothetical protein